MSTLQARRRIKNLLLFIPNLILLCVRLMKDSRVSGTDRALVAGAVIYAIIPLDLIPDMLPFVGQIDDLYLISLTLLRLLDRADPRLVREHWNGGGDVVQLVESMVTVTSKLLPRRIQRVLTSRVEVASDKKGRPVRPLLVARPEAESDRAAS
ncbi:MAG TPA: YkvA family protein [Pyrinomonadaceae bacterium]|nr:YkvA family protein [Pyrinomonadaceae bacterium]